MTSDIDANVVKAIRALYRTDEIAKRFLDQCAVRERDATATSAERMANRLGISREEGVGLAQRLAEAGCGEFVVGRRGYKSRLVWDFSCISIGQAAAGETSHLEKVEDAEPDSDDDHAQEVVSAPKSAFTIQDAKTALAASLGIPESSIEIIIRA